MAEERKLILKMLHENRISVDEADQLLSAIESKSNPANPAKASSAQEAPRDSSVFEKTAPKVEQFMGGLSSMIDSVSQQLGPNIEKRFEGWFQQKAAQQQSASQSPEAPVASNRSEVTLPVDSASQKLRCFHKLGDLKIEAYDGQEIQAILDKQITSTQLETKRKFEDLRLLSRQEGPILLLELPGSEGLKSSEGTVKLTLKVPASLDLDLATEGHDIVLSKLSRTQGQVRLESQSGDLEVQDIAIKRLDLQTQSGDIFASQATELSVIQTQSGNIKLKGAIYEAQVSTMSGQAHIEAGVNHLLKAETRSGDLNLQLLDGAGRLDLRSQSGDVELSGQIRAEASLQSASGDLQCDLVITETGSALLSSKSGDVDLILRPQSQCKVEAKATTGEIECRVELQQKESSEHALHGMLGEASGILKIQTESGDILIS